MKTDDGKIINERQLDWGQIIIFIITVVFLAGGAYASLFNHESRIKVVEEKCDKIDVIISEVGWIKDTMKQVYKIK
jgi:hypothetical protein